MVTTYNVDETNKIILNIDGNAAALTAEEFIKLVSRIFSTLPGYEVHYILDQITRDEKTDKDTKCLKFEFNGREAAIDVARGLFKDKFSFTFSTVIKEKMKPHSG